MEAQPKITQKIHSLIKLHQIKIKPLIMQLMRIMNMIEEILPFQNLRARMEIKKEKRKQIFKIKKNFMRIMLKNEIF